MGPDSAPGPAVPWRKVLWERQPYPDNYVDQRFLEELRRNEGIRQYPYWAMVREAGFVGQQVSCVAIFITLWLYMEQVKHKSSITLDLNSVDGCKSNTYTSFSALFLGFPAPRDTVVDQPWLCAARLWTLSGLTVSGRVEQ